MLAGLGEDDTVLLAFAGHGVVFKGDDASYFCPADAQLDDKDTLLSLTDVYRELEQCKAGTNLLMVDACRNDPLSDKSRATGKLDLESVTRPPEPAKDGGVAAFFSCSRGQKAYEDDRSKHGAFFHFVIEGLRGEASDFKDEVSLLELGAYVQRRVSDFTQAEYGVVQKPEMTYASAQGAAALVRVPLFVKAYRRGTKLVVQKNYAKAVAAFTEALQDNPHYTPALTDRADAYNGLREYDKAIADCDEALRLDPNIADAYCSRGKLPYEPLGPAERHDKALEDLNKAILLDPKNTWSYLYRSTIWLKRNDKTKALDDLNEALHCDPQNVGGPCARSTLLGREERNTTRRSPTWTRSFRSTLKTATPSAPAASFASGRRSTTRRSRT